MGGCSATCERCGMTYFDTYNTHYTWDDGELEGLKAKADEDPKNWRAVDGSVGGYMIFGCRVLDTCDCGPKLERMFLSEQGCYWHS